MMRTPHCKVFLSSLAVIFCFSFVKADLITITSQSYHAWGEMYGKIFPWQDPEIVNFETSQSDPLSIDLWGPINFTHTSITLDQFFVSNSGYSNAFMDGYGGVTSNFEANWTFSINTNGPVAMTISGGADGPDYIINEGISDRWAQNINWALFDVTDPLSPVQIDSKQYDFTGAYYPGFPPANMPLPNTNISDVVQLSGAPSISYKVKMWGSMINFNDLSSNGIALAGFAPNYQSNFLTASFAGVVAEVPELGSLSFLLAGLLVTAFLYRQKKVSSRQG
jgi:hypothetical protein